MSSPTFNSLASFMGGAEMRDKWDARKEARANKLRIAEASRLASGGDQAALGTLWSLDPERAKNIGEQFRWADERGRAEKKMHLERLAGAAVRADTPEKWDAAVDLYAAQDPSLAMYRGQFALRDSIIGGLAGVDGMLDEARDEQDFAEKVRQYEKSFGLQARQQDHVEAAEGRAHGLRLQDFFLKQDDQRYRHMDGDRSHALKLDDFLLKQDDQTYRHADGNRRHDLDLLQFYLDENGQAFDQAHRTAQFQAGREDRAFDEAANVRDYDLREADSRNVDYRWAEEQGLRRQAAALAEQKEAREAAAAEAKAAQGPAPLTELGKNQVDLAHGYISQEAYDAAAKKATRSGPTSEHERKLAVFGRMMTSTASHLEAYEQKADAEDWWQRAAGDSYAANWIARSPEYRRYESAALTWTAGYLALISGQAVSEQEVQRNRIALFPRPGDDMETVVFKRGLRKEIESGVRTAGGDFFGGGAQPAAPQAPPGGTGAAGGSSAFGSVEDAAAWGARVD